jgi:hypothetical protein
MGHPDNNQKRLGVDFKNVKKMNLAQGCQIFLGTIYQNEGKYTKLPQHYQMAIKYTK